jgi:acetyl esterase
MPLHPHIQTALAAGVGLPAYSELPIAQARAQAKRAYPPNPSPVAVAAVRDLFIPGPDGAGSVIPMRIYTPAGPGPHPLVMFFHGSGFVILDLDTHDDICRRLCAGAASVVASVDYRLAPEHKFPAAPDDCLAATRWMAANASEFDADETRIVVAGDSAGGCLAAVTALRIRDEGGPALRGQLLLYPVTDYPSASADSYRAFGVGYGLTSQSMQWFWHQYLTHASQAGHPHVSPLRTEAPAGLASACILVAQYDVLFDEGMAFAHKLRQAGVPTVARSYDGMNHGFLKYAGVLEQADAAIADACGWLKNVLRDEPSKVPHG